MIVTKTFPAKRTLNHIFDDFFGSVDQWPVNHSVPVNIVEQENGFELQFNAPGRVKENFKINLEKGMLTVSYEKPEDAQKSNERLVRKEFVTGNFKRSFNLEEKINTDAIAARYENGILTIALPKKEDVKSGALEITVQ